MASSVRVRTRCRGSNACVFDSRAAHPCFAAVRVFSASSESKVEDMHRGQIDSAVRRTQTLTSTTFFYRRSCACFVRYADAQAFRQIRRTKTACGNACGRMRCGRDACVRGGGYRATPNKSALGLSGDRALGAGPNAFPPNRTLAFPIRERHIPAPRQR